MADNKLLLKRGAGEDFLAEDDPLAALARIAGFDPAPVAKPIPQVQPPLAQFPQAEFPQVQFPVAQSPLAQSRLAQRREPVFDLEDELLKELEIYARPAAVERTAAVAEPVFAPAVGPEFPREPEPAFEPAPELIAPEINAVEPVAERAPVLLEAVETIADASDGRVYERPASHPVFDLEDEILREFAAFDARQVEGYGEHSLEAEVVRQEVVRQEPADLAPVPAELHDVPDMRAPFAREQGREIYDSFRDDDLDAEIAGMAEPRLAPEMLAVPDDAVPQPDGTVEAGNAFGEPSSGPVDDGDWAERDDAAVPAPEHHDVFGQADGQADIPYGDAPAELHAAPAGETAFAPPAMEEFAEPLADEPEIQNFADALPRADAAAPADVQPALPSLENRALAQPVASRDYGLDELLAEVEQYPVGDAAGRWGVQSKPVAVEEAQPTAAPAVVALPVSHEPANLAAEPRETAAAADAEDIGDLSFDDSSFELDLGDIELDLDDLHDADFSVSPELLTEIAQAPVAETPVSEMPVEQAPVAPVQAVASEPAYRQPVGQPVDTDYSSLPFDPSQIGQEEEAVEAIAEMDVPEVPVVHEEERPAPHPEYDIDLDAEMAQLFATAAANPGAAQKAGQTQDNVAGFGPVPARAASTPLDLDEFERALEEDFRRSFAENHSAAHPDRVALAPAYDNPGPARKSRGWMLMASAAVAIVLFGGAGVYAFMSGDTRMLVSSEPKVILADTDPVKVVPDDPGGKQVPNQNKAVYDRVSGSKTDQTKQETLLTSNEEPVDVVQRTLMPEALPMDEDVMTLTTPTGDTVDPRLLPDEAEQERVTTTSKVVSGVSPRKVKTMVVRPDGTLVEREVTEDDLKQQASNDAELMKIAQKAAQDAATASDSQGDDIAKAIENVPERLAPADTAASAVTAGDDKTARAAEPDVVPEPVADPIDAASVEATPPAVDEAADDVAESVQKTELKPTDAAVEDKPAERSIVVDSQSPIIDESAVADAADAEVDVEDAPVRKVKTTKIAPVPENRPAEQPVTVVGTVTDQGTVRSDGKAKTQEVALADQTAQIPAETTAVPSGSYVIQIASLPSEAEAQSSYSRLSAKFAGIIGGRGVDIRKAEIKNKGTYYRVRIPAGSKQDAQALCADYKRAGGSCLVSK